ncbi:MAG: alpha/beta fold hydrolase [Flavobacteriia bacterium]|nr:alpha/beta fold hydrolase [Flavobacteriia bacterium]
MKKFLILSSIILSLGCNGQHLERKLFHGFRLQPGPDNSVQVAATGPTGTATNAELQSNDIILKINEIEIEDFNSLRSSELQNLRAGEEVRYTVKRGDQTLELVGIGEPLPEETGDSPQTRYFEIPFDGGHLRAIANLPEGEGPFPTVYFIQGYTCSSIESNWPGHPYRQLAKAFTEAGIAFVRVEKPGVGDSQGMEDCMETDFHYEVQSFTEAGKYVRKFDWVDADQFYIFGHSMGGYLAPIVAKEVPSAGIAAYGTRHEPWREYFLQMWRFQLVRQGFSYSEVEERMGDYYNLAYHLFYLKESPEEIAQSHPELVDEMEDGLAWSGGDVILFRNYDALQSVDELPVVPSWLSYEGKVLIFYGTADFEVCSDESPKEMVRMMNIEHPGSAEYVEIQGADHSMFQVGSMEEAVNMSDEERRSAMMKGIDQKIPRAIIEWTRE